jgi:hypothetical protein
MSKIKVQCAHCDRAAACAGVYEASEGAVSPACNVCCGHGNEDGWCEPIENFILTSAGLLKSPVPAPSQDAADSSCEDHRTPHCPRCEPERPAVQSDGAPSAFIERTFIRWARRTFSYTPGTDRQPSSQSASPLASRISGLTNTRNSSCVAEISMTITLLCTSTWVAARPTPGAAYMVSAMSLINLRILSSTRSTLVATLCRRGSG